LFQIRVKEEMSTNMASNNKPKLTLATYLCPSLPVELFQLLAEFLEQDLGCEVTLVYEWRAQGPLPGRPDPFADNSVHLGELLNLVDGRDLCLSLGTL